MLGKSDLIELLTAPGSKKEPAAFESKAAANRAVDAVVEAIKNLTSRKEVEGLSIVGFGSFKRVKRNARVGRNPATGEKIKIKASKSLSFKISKAFKEALK